MKNFILKRIYFLVLCIIFARHEFAYAESQCEKLNQTYELHTQLKELHSSEVQRLKRDFYSILDMARVDLPKAILDIDKLKETISSVKICLNDSNHPLLGSAIRKGSVYFNKEKIFVINYQEILNRNESIGLSLMLLHEVLGASGIDDQNYQLTALVYSSIHRNYFGEDNLRRINDSVSKHLQSAALPIENIRFQSSGGISGVGGGGDPEIAILKALVLNYFLANSDYFDRLHKTSFSLGNLTDYILSYQIETMTEIEFNELPSPVFPNMQYQRLNNRTVIRIKENSWKKLMSNPSALDARTTFIQNLTNLILLNYKATEKEVR